MAKTDETTDDGVLPGMRGEDPVTEPETPSSDVASKPPGSAQGAAKKATKVAGNGKTTPAAPKKTTKATSKKTAKKAAAKPERVPRLFPLRSLYSALVVPQAIKSANAGNPYRTEDVATALGYSSTSTGGFFYLVSASKDYGLTVGGSKSERIELSALGRDIVYPASPEQERARKIDAFFQVDLFKRVFDHYRGTSAMPTSDEYLFNTLIKDFGLHSDHCKEFTEVFRANCKYLDIESGLEGRDASGDRGGRGLGAGNAVSADIRVVGDTAGKYSRTAFVIMPFSEKGEKPRPKGFFNEVLRSLITPAGNAAGFEVQTAKVSGSEIIQSTIINQLLKADLVIADLTDHNPNVLFELGVRIALEFPVALIKAEGTSPIFDVDHLLRVLSYDPNLWTSTISDDVPRLTEHFKATWDNATKNSTYMSTLTAKHSEPAAA